jgi:hypothetical protein
MEWAVKLDRLPGKHLIALVEETDCSRPVALPTVCVGFPKEERLSEPVSEKALYGVLSRLASADEGPRDEVVQASLPRRPADHQEAQVERDQREDLGPVASTRTAKRDAPAPGISNPQATGELAERGLAGRTLHQGVIQPRDESQQPDAGSEHRFENQKRNREQEPVDDVRSEADPETAVPRGFRGQETGGRPMPTHRSPRR